MPQAVARKEQDNEGCQNPCGHQVQKDQLRTLQTEVSIFGEC